MLNPAWYFVRPSAALSTLQVAEWLRFGNSVSQLINVFALAERYGIRRIRLPSQHLFYQSAGVGDVVLQWGRERRLSGLALSGYFLHTRALMPPLDAGTQRSIVDRRIRPLLAQDLLRSDPRVGVDDLVMHFRDGDVFDTEDVKPGYWQPPLAYYLAVFERDCPRRVWLVFEDRRNPTVAGVEEALRLRGVEVVVQSGTLLDDLRVLLSARRLVASVGTFVPAGASLSPTLPTHSQLTRP